MTGEICFNPTMVRLLPKSLAGTATTANEFQSHNGAIAAPQYSLHFAGSPLFQSHNGAIAARQRPTHGQGLGFNPTMVRLLQSTRT